ncbi:hypothetical protein B0T17DRAFT_2464 [Bombardia bombarda]|uniref:C2H2-type domain-containing protein n=1 Tax=Bombardia bombarda TaxID=252184 RepID=A0AA40CDE1_9PEZI|nr:hypothetical protein B0T17DRAFT_2464 [Bombardia bombarda]
MDSYDSGSNLPPAESLVSRRKKAIVAKSMAIFESHLNKWLDTTLLDQQPGKGGSGSSGGRRKRARASDDQDSAVEDCCGGGADKGSGGVNPKNTKKRLRRSEPVAAVPAAPRRRFACPFSKHDPARYKSVKTCCGPGWTDVHRVKEHIYRRHTLKNVCPRCLDRFDSNDDLKRHQRAETPCRLEKVNVPEAINDEQEITLRQRAKANCSDEEKWREMYRVIFPSESDKDDDSNGNGKEKDKDGHIPSPFKNTNHRSIRPLMCFHQPWLTQC